MTLDNEVREEQSDFRKKKKTNLKNNPFKFILERKKNVYS